MSILRFFFKIFSQKMFLNCKLSGLNGSTCSNLKLKKGMESLRVPICRWRWRREFHVAWLFFIALGFVWFILVLKYGNLRSLNTTAEMKEDGTQILLANFSVSREEFDVLASFFFETDEITSLTCQKESGAGIPHKYSVTCALRAPRSSDHIVEKHYKWIYGQCPVQDESFFISHGPLVVKDKSPSFIPLSTSSPVSSVHLHCSENVPKSRALEDDATDHCGRISFCFMKMRWWVLIAVAVSCKLAALCKKFWSNQKKKLVKLQPLAEKPQLLQQLQQQHAQISSRSAGKWRKKLLVVFVLAGVVGSVWLFWYMNQDISLRRKDVLASMCDERARMLQDQFNVSMNHVHALAILVSAFHHEKQPSAIDQKTFEEYTERTAFERPLTSGVAYALRVRHSEREQFEKLHGWTIKKMETEDQTLAQDSTPENLDSSPVQDEYAPVIFSQKTVSHIVSIDMMSGKEDRENILRARASGKGVLTSPFKLLKSNHLGVVLTFAVYNTNLPPNPTRQQRIDATVGYIGASYDVPSLVEKLLHQLASKQTIVVNVYDTTNGSAPIKMYGTNETDTGLLHISHLDFGDPARKHEMHCRFKQKPPPPWTAITASVGVLVITLLLGHIFHAAINRIAKVESDYREMMELKHRAEAADIAKSQFLATVSHEIRTPMNGVLGMLQMLMDTNLDATQMDYAQTAHNSGSDLISLINEVLDQAKIESGRLELEAVPFDLRAVLDNVLSLFSTKSHGKGIELAVYVSKQVPKVVIGDPGRFRQIITNLVGNSIKFTDDKGHIFVSVHLADEVADLVHAMDEVLRHSLSLAHDPSNTSCDTLSGYPVVDRWRSWEKFKKLNGAVEEDGKIKLLLTVEDTGVGIPLEAQDRIFMPFMQADSSTSRTYGGTGIGLSISKRLVDLMGGEIGFVSERGKGSTFSFTAVFTVAETTSLDKKQQPYDAAISEFRGLRALVVDEKIIRAEVTKYHLQRLGMLVDIASTVSSACSCISSFSKRSESQPFSLVLIDKDSLGKESLTVYTLLKEIKSNGSVAVIGMAPKIILSATCISSTECDELKSAGLVDDVLVKPLRLSVLISCFQEATGFGKKRQFTRDRPKTLGNLLRGKQILVVDDNVVNRRVAEGALKKYGAIVTCVVSGKAAKELLTPPHRFDACFMDLQMPEMDGFEATRQIRILESEYKEKIDSGEITVDFSAKVSCWHTPVLAMTADVIQATNEECMKCGMDGYVSKPFEEGQLYSAVARFFESGCKVRGMTLQQSLDASQV